MTTEITTEDCYRRNVVCSYFEAMISGSVVKGHFLTLCNPAKSQHQHPERFGKQEVAEEQVVLVS